MQRRFFSHLVTFAVLLFAASAGASSSVRKAAQAPVPAQDAPPISAIVQASSLIRAEAARSAYSVSGSGLTVAVVDTGIRSTHQDFEDRVIAERNFTGDNGGVDDDASDGNGQGTHVAGIVAANGPHVGVAPGAEIVAVKVTDNAGDAPFTRVIEALDYIIDNRAALGITVVVLSPHDTSNTTAQVADDLHDRIQTLRTAGVPVVVPAGDAFFEADSEEGMAYPAVFGNTVSVGAVYDSNVGQQSYAGGATASSTGASRITPFSQRLHPNTSTVNRTDIFAPGAIITSTGVLSDTGEAQAQGTVQAAGFVAGAILLLQEFYERQEGALPTVDQLEGWLRGGGVVINDGDDEDDNVTNTGRDFRRLDVLGALEAVETDLGTFRIRGRVTEDGAGLAGVTVTADGKTGTTDAEGNYTIPGLDAGTYTVTPSRSGYTFDPTSRSVTVGPNQNGVNFEAEKETFSISGRVLAEGQGVNGAAVTINGFTTSSGAGGFYSFSGLAAGDYTISVSHSGYTFAQPSRTVTVGPSRTDIDFVGVPVVEPRFSISGTVRAGINPLAGVTVTAGGRSATTNASGAYTISGLNAATYTVTASRAGFVFTPASQSVTVGPDATGVNFTTSSAGIYQVSGTITLDGTGLEGVEVTAGSQTTETDADGNYLLDGLAPGSYVVTPSLVGYAFNPGSRSVSVGPDRTGVNFTAVRRYAISGRILSGGTGVAGVTVTAGGVTATTAEDGSYVLLNLAPATYTVRASGQGFTFNPASRRVQVTDEDVPDIDFAATAAPRLTALALRSTDVRGGRSVAATVRFDRRVRRNTQVIITAVDSRHIRFPRRVTVAKGRAAASFTIRANRVLDVTPVTITATHNGISRSQTLRVFQ